MEIHEDKAVFRSGSLTVETSRYTTAPDGSLAETSLYTWLRALVADDSETVDVNGVGLARDAMTLMTESVLTRPIYAFADLDMAFSQAVEAQEELIRKAEEMTGQAVAETLAQGAQYDIANLMEIVNEINEEKTEEEEQEEEDNEEKRILERLPEEKIAEYINETLKRVIKGENMLDDMKTFMDFVRIIPNKMFDENSEYYATVLSNATINGVKLFDDINAAREFVNNIRNRRRSKKWLRPKAQKQIKQEIQKSLQISPMMLKNIKHRTNAINVYQY